MATRRFGSQINGDRKVLGSLPVHPKTGVVLKPAHTVKNEKFCAEDQENQEFAYHQSLKQADKHLETFKVESQNTSVDEGIFSQDVRSSQYLRDERLLDQSYEALKQNLDSIMIDSEEKENTYDESLFSPDCDASKLADDESELATSEMEHSDCSLAPASPFNSLDKYGPYAHDVLKYCLGLERKFLPDAGYMVKQSEINVKMRAILVDWLVDVCDEYHLHDETLFIAVQYVDRYLSKAAIARTDFQLLGISALFIASKYEEIYPPELHEFSYTTDDSASKSQILTMEKNILRVLQFDVSSPTAFYFLKKFACDLNTDKDVYYYAKYLCSMTLLDTAFLHYLPSEVALSALILAFRIFSQDFPLDYLASTVAYEESLGRRGDVSGLLAKRNQLMDELIKLQNNSAELPQQSIVKKYSGSKYSRVAKLCF